MSKISSFKEGMVFYFIKNEELHTFFIQKIIWNSQFKPLLCECFIEFNSGHVKKVHLRSSTSGILKIHDNEMFFKPVSIFLQPNKAIRNHVNKLKGKATYYNQQIAFWNKRHQKLKDE